MNNVCAGDGDGELRLRELAAMLTDLRLPDITKADILYTQVREILGQFQKVEVIVVGAAWASTAPWDGAHLGGSCSAWMLK